MGSIGDATTNRQITTAEQEKTLKKIVKQTANLKKEQYRVIDENGNVVFKKQGKNDSVAMTVGEKRQYLDGAVTTHNHPEVNEGLGGPPSSNDLTDFGYGAREIVIASPEGVYRLRNLNYGTPEQKAGWINLRNEIEKIQDRQSSIADIRKSNEMMEKTQIAKEMHKISDQWLAKRNAGASEEELRKYSSKYMELEKTYKTQLHQLRRKLELQPYHDAYKKYARKYGFEYVYPKGAF